MEILLCLIAPISKNIEFIELIVNDTIRFDYMKNNLLLLKFLLSSSQIQQTGSSSNIYEQIIDFVINS
jgi:hypothetical protein